MTSSASEVAYLSRALKMPRVPKAAKVFAERARDEGWDYEAFLAAVLSEEANQRESRGSHARIKAARFPQVKTLDDFDFTFQRSVKRQIIAHLAQLDALRVSSFQPAGFVQISTGVDSAYRGDHTSPPWRSWRTASQLASDERAERAGSPGWPARNN